jgi:DNA invertase Pin-like site-specific DNA recombinase
LRISTQKQGASGLGVEAQRKAVLDYLNGGAWALVAEVVEVESGKRADRPKLAEALRLCRLHGATLIIARLDRLARNVAFVSNLMESGVDFLAVDFPEANRLTVHIIAAVAEHEAKCISERTKAALQAAKARGVRLGGRQWGSVMTDDMRRAGCETRARNANARAGDIAPTIAELRAAGVTTLGGIARELMARGIPAPLGGAQWRESQVSRLLARIA